MIYNQDCMEVFKTIKDESIDLFVTDCPYKIVGGGCSKEDHKNPSGIFRKDNKGNRYYTESNHVSLCGILNDYDPTTYAKNGTLFKHNDIEFSTWLPEVYRILKPNTHCYVMINARNFKNLQQAAEDAGFIFQQILIWDKGNATPNKYYMNAFEMILMLRKGKAKNINNMGTTNVLRIPNVRNKKHPTEKPVSLMRVLIENSSQEGDIVMDSFMGAGAAGVACRQLDREFIGVELDEKYYKIAEDRINQVDEQMTIFDFI